jgi:hypothetical protein
MAFRDNSRDRPDWFGYALSGESSKRSPQKFSLPPMGAMFTVRLTEETRPGASVMARAPTLEGATGFVREYFGLDFGVIAGWEERNGRYVMDIYDWLDCWFANPPVVARIIAPRGFTPSKMTDFV